MWFRPCIAGQGRPCHARAHDPNTAGLFGLAKSNKGVQVLCLTIPSSTSRGSFKKIVQNGHCQHCQRTFPSDFVKLVSENEKYFIYFWQKNCRLLFCLFCLFQYFIRLWLTFLIEALIELRKMIITKKLFDVRFGNCSVSLQPKYQDSADLLDLQRYN